MRPVLQAILVADRVYQDVSGKKIIAGTFNRIRFQRDTRPPAEQELPDGTKRQMLRGGGHPGSPYAYISLTDVCGPTDLVLQFVNLTQNAVLFETKLTVNCNDRLATVEIVAPLPPLFVREAGSYAFEVVCEGEILGTHRIQAEEVPPAGE